MPGGGANWREYENKRLQKRLGISSGELEELQQDAAQNRVTVVEYLAGKSNLTPEEKAERYGGTAAQYGGINQQDWIEGPTGMVYAPRSALPIPGRFGPGRVSFAPPALGNINTEQFAHTSIRSRGQIMAGGLGNAEEQFTSRLNPGQIAKLIKAQEAQAKRAEEFWKTEEFRAWAKDASPMDIRQMLKDDEVPLPARPEAIARASQGSWKQVQVSKSYDSEYGPMSYTTTETRYVVEEPRYVMVRDPVTGEAMPFYTQDQREAERQAAKEYFRSQYTENPTWGNAIKYRLLETATVGGGWLQDKLYTGFGIGSGFWTWGGQTEEELATQEKPGSLGAMTQLLFNLGAAGVAWFKDMRYILDPERTQEVEKENAAYYRELAMNAKTPAERADYIKMAERAEQYASDESLSNALERWQLAKDAVEKSWNALLDSREERLSLMDEGKIDIHGRPTPEYEAQLERERKTALAMSLQLTDQATSLYRMATETTDEARSKQLIERALVLQAQAIEQRRISDPMDALGAITWGREPERYDSFLNNMALLEMQLGRELSIPEIRRLKDYHTNMWTELSFQLIFDATNLIPVLGPVGNAAGDIIKRVPIVSSLLEGAKASKLRIISNLQATPVVGMMFRDSVSTVATKIERVMGDNFARMLKPYVSASDVVAQLPKFAEAIKAVKGLPIDDAERVFEAVKLEFKGAQEIDFKTFKAIADTTDASKIDPDKWVDLFEDALNYGKKIELERLTKQAVQEMGKGFKASDLSQAKQLELQAMAKAISYNPKRIGLALEHFVSNFGSAYTNAHRIYKGGRLLDDSLAGQIQKYARLASGDLDDLMKNKLISPDVMAKPDNKFVKATELAVINWGAKRSDETRKFLEFLGVNALETLSKAAQLFRDLWAMLVLSTPRWLITNYIDSATRSWIYGGNPFDDLYTLMFSAQTHFIDDIGFNPLEFGQSLARTELSFAERIPVKIAFEGYRPRFGIFSYWADEFKRLKGTRTERILSRMDELGEDALKTEMGRNIYKSLDKSLKSKFAATWDGFWTVPKAFAGGIADYNTAIEFTLRTRMFHREYTKLLEKLAPDFANRGMDALTPAMREIAQRIWNASGGSPAKINSLVDAMTKGVKPEDRAAWAFMIPDTWDDILSKVDPDFKAVFTYHVRDNINNFVEHTLKTKGRMPDKAEFSKFVDGLKEEAERVGQIQVAGALELRGTGGPINPNRTANAVPEPGSTSGAAPVMPGPNKNIVEAAEALTKRRLKPTARIKDRTKFVDEYQTAVTPYVKVENVAGNTVNVTTRNGELVMQVGDKVKELPVEQMYETLYRASIDMLAERDRDFVKIGNIFKSMDEYKTSMDEFMTDPTGLMNKNQRQFIAILDNIGRDSQLRDVFKGVKYSPGDLRPGYTPFDSAYDAYLKQHKFDVTAEQMLDYKTSRKVMQDMTDSVLAPNVARREGATLFNLASVNAFDLARNSKDIELLVSMRRYDDVVGGTMAEWENYLREFIIGPKMEIIGKGSRRSSAWEAWELEMAEMYRAEAKFRDSLADVMKTDPAKAREMLQDAIDKAPERFLDRMGVEILWDDDKTQIIRAKIAGVYTAARGKYSPITALEARFFNKQIGTVSSPFLKVDPSNPMPVRKQLAAVVNESFGVPMQQAHVVSRLIESHADMMAKLAPDQFKSPLDYLAHLGFQKVEKGYELPGEARKLVSGAVAYNKEADAFTLFGTASNDLPGLIRAASTVFLEDMVFVAQKNEKIADMLKPVITQIKAMTGKGVDTQAGKIVGRLDDDQLEAFSKIFMDYLITGDLELKGSRKAVTQFSNWLGDMFEVIKDTRVGQELPQDVYNAMGEMFIRKAMKPPKTQRHSIRIVAAEMGYGSSKPEDILKMVNTASASKTVSNAVELEAEYTDLNTRLWSYVGRDKSTMSTEELQAMHDIRKRMGEIDDILRPIGNKYGSIDDVPMNEIVDVLSKAREGAAVSRYNDELKNAFDVWKLRRDFTNYPESALGSVEDLKTYLRGEIDNAKSDVMAEAHEMLLYQVEMFESDFSKIYAKYPTKFNVTPQGVSIPPASIDWNVELFPTLKPYQMDTGTQTAFRNISQTIDNLKAVDKALDELKVWITSDKWKMPILSAESAEQLRKWAKVGNKSKSELIGLVLNGGRHAGLNIEGAINKVNRVMLDYSSRSGFDNLMKNIFPFWMFPSRSVPFWIKTLATHPQIISQYNKLKRLSESARYQAGAVTSRGKPLSSMDGYIPIPGTDMWFNPLAPMSFKYVISMFDFDDSYVPQTGDDDNVPIGAWMTQKFLEGGPIFGFSVSPWVSYGLKEAFNIPDYALPQLPWIPEIPLIPRWIIPDHIRMGDKWYSNLINAAYPEATFNDYLVERRILQDALEIVNDPSSSRDEKTAAVTAARQAISERESNPLWQDTYKMLANEQSVRSGVSFFFGFYPKEFSDGMADLLALRDQNNLMKSSLNNVLQSVVFDIPLNADMAWERYLNISETSEGELYRLYGLIGWVRDENNQIVRDPQERARYLKMSIEEDENQRTYYNKLIQLQEQLQNSLRKVPIGMPYDYYEHIFIQYSEDKAQLSKDFPFQYNTSYLTNKPMEIIERETRYEWIRYVNSTRPVWRPEDNYEEYQARVAEWERNLPRISAQLIRAFTRREDIAMLFGNLRPDQKNKMTKDFFAQLVSIGNVEGIREWRRETDDVMDALNNAWEALYWNPYWEGPGAIITRDDEPDRWQERALAEEDFARNHRPPTEEQMWKWIVSYYGPDRFSRSEIHKWMNWGQTTDVFAVEDRLRVTKGEEYMARREITNLFNWIGPAMRDEFTSRINLELAEALARNPEFTGRTDKILTRWMEQGQGDIIFADQTENLRIIAETLKDIYAKYGISRPDRSRLVEFVQVEDSNNQFKWLVEQPKEKGGLGIPYEYVQEIQSDYFDNYAGSREKSNKFFKDQETREEGQYLRDYWRLRQTYARVDPLWGEYKLWKPVPEFLEEIDASWGITYGQVDPTSRRVSVTFPDGLEEELGTVVADIIKDAANGEAMSVADVNHLRNFAIRNQSTNPEWSEFIYGVLREAP